MTEVIHPTKAEWLEDTGLLLECFEEMHADDQRIGGAISQRGLDTVAEIRSTIEIYSKWTDEEFEAWRDGPSPGEDGYEKHQASHHHLRLAPIHLTAKIERHQHDRSSTQPVQRRRSIHGI
jgi:hypothetical protein